MPNYIVWPKAVSDARCHWVYAVDEWDAREQVGTTLHVDAHDKKSFGCQIDARFKTPLSIVLHSSGDWTKVVRLDRLFCVIDSKSASRIC
jgi:hypothetical protein